MNTYRRRPVTQIITDTGPLISLACADRLNLLNTFRKPVLIPDVIIAECLRKGGAPGERTLRAFFEAPEPGRFERVPTPMGPVMEGLIQRERNGERVEELTGFGDATIAWVIANIKRLKGPDEIALVLTQDATFGDEVLPRLSEPVHVLSFRAWLGFLESQELIPSAREVAEEMLRAGPAMTRYYADRPAQLDSGTRSEWTSAVSAEPS